MKRGIHFTQVFSSDLQRAQLTAEGICRERNRQRCQLQSRAGKDAAAVTVSPFSTPDLREQDFGSREGTRWDVSDDDPDATASDTFVAPESEASMRERANRFISENLLPLLFEEDDGANEKCVGVVAHGIILRVLWRCLVRLFEPQGVVIKPDVRPLSDRPGRSFMPVWSNTGFLELEIRQKVTSSLPAVANTTMSNGPVVLLDVPSPVEVMEDSALDCIMAGWSLAVIAVNSREHLVDLRRTRGGIGSATHDDRQQRIDRFFPKHRNNSG